MTPDELDALPVANGTHVVMDERGYQTLVRDAPVFLARDSSWMFMQDREGRLWNVGRDIYGVLRKERNHAAEAALIVNRTEA